MERGKSVLPPSKFTVNRKKDYWIHKSDGLTHRDILKRDIDEVISNTTNWKAFDLYLKNLGYSYARNNDYRHPSIIAPGWKRSVRLDSLGEQYTQEKIRQRLIDNQKNITLYAIRIPKRYAPLLQLEYEFNKAQRMDGMQLAFALIIELWKLITGNNIEPLSPKPLSPALRQEVRKLDQTLRNTSFFVRIKLIPHRSLFHLSRRNPQIFLLWNQNGRKFITVSAARNQKKKKNRTKRRQEKSLQN